MIVSAVGTWNSYSRTIPSPPPKMPFPPGAIAAEGDIVHRPLARSRDSVRKGLGQGAEEDVDDTLGRLHVPPGACGWEFGVDDGPFGRHDLEWPHQPRIEGDVLLDERPEDVENGRAGNGEVGVDPAFGLGRGGAEIDDGLVAANGDADGDLDRPRGDPVIVEVIDESIVAVGDVAGGLPRDLPGG